jgi:lysozyme family protein
MSNLMNYAKDFSTKKMMQDIEEKIQSYLSEEDKPVEPKGMLERKNSTNEIDGDSVVADSLANLITKASDNKAKRYRGMNFRAERPRSSPEEINEFLANMKEVNRIAPGFYYDKDDRNNPMDFSGSIVKEDRQTDALIDIAETALEQPIEIPTLDIAEAIEQDQVEQQDTSTLKGNEVGLMAKPVQDTTEEVEEDTTTPTRDELIDSVFDAEGGYSTDRNDTGNYYQNQFIGTNHGISAPVLAEYLGRTPTVQDMRDLSEDTAREIAATQYYDRYNIADLPNETQEIVFHAVYMGGSRGVRAVQNLTGSTPDGIMGPNTRQAMRDSTFTPQEFRDEYLRELEFGTQGYSDPSATWDDHGRGWTNRYNDLAGD